MSYQAPYTAGKGYYDLNKNQSRGKENSMCYLGAAGNMIYWWLNQNETYVTEYLKQLKNTDHFSQPDGLVSILPFQEKMWKDMYEEPPINLVDGAKYVQELGTSKLVLNALNNYYYRPSGYFMDLVFDFYFNGYPAQTGEAPMANVEEDYTMDKRGGFFYPLLGRQKISERIDNPRYSFYNEHLADILNQGYGITLAYNVNHSYSHALTLWGAEYDENNNLCRFYVTDTDDYDNVVDFNSALPRGIHSYEVRTNKNGSLCITSITDPSVSGPQILSIHILDLAQDLLEQRLRDVKEPDVPTILSEPLDSQKPKGAKVELSVDAKADDAFYMTYQWYSTDILGAIGEKIPKATNSTLTVTSDTIGSKYYYCVITNHKNGKEVTAKTRYAKVTFDNSPLTHAQTPSVQFDAGKIKVKQYSAKPLTVRASVQDGGTLSFQWYTSRDSSPQNVLKKLEGETSNVLVPSTASPGTTFYFCEVTNTKLDATGNQTATVKTYAKAVEVYESESIDAKEPVILKQPRDYTIQQNDSQITLQVKAKSIDGGKLTYQWYRSSDSQGNDDLIPNATDATLNLSGLTPDTYYYYCVIKNTQEKASQNKTAQIESKKAKIVVQGEKPLNPPTLHSDIYKVADGYIQNVLVGTLVKDFSKNFSDSSALVILNHGQPVSENERISTGMVVELHHNQKVVDSAVIIVTGDVQADGFVDSKDYDAVVRFVRGAESPSELSMFAADLEKDGTIDAFDIALIYQML